MQGFDQEAQNYSKRKGKEKKNTPERQEPSRKRQTVLQTVVGNTECATFLDCNLTVCIQCSQLYKTLISLIHYFKHCIPKKQ